MTIKPILDEVYVGVCRKCYYRSVLRFLSFLPYLSLPFFISRLRLHRLFIYGYEAFSKRSNKLYLRCSPKFRFFLQILANKCSGNCNSFFWGICVTTVWLRLERGNVILEKTSSRISGTFFLPISDSQPMVREKLLSGAPKQEYLFF